MRLVLAAVLLAVVTPALARAEDAPAPHTWQVGDASLRLIGVPPKPGGELPTQRLEILRDGKVLLSFENELIAVDQWLNAPDDVPFPPLGTNLTGGTVPQVIVQEYSGGAHCCESVKIVELGTDLKVVDVPIGRDFFAYFRRQEGEAGWIAVGYDETYNYWHASFAETPAQQLLYRFSGSAWRLATDLMRRPAPSEEELKRKATEVRDSADWGRPINDNPKGIPPRLWSEALKLAYSGNLDAAERFFDLAWRPDFRGKTTFRRQLFACRLRKSPVWPDLAAMNSRPALPPEGKCE